MLVAVIFLMSLSIVPAFLLLPDGYEEFFAGVVLTSAIAVCVHLVVVVSGSTHLMMGDLGEQWSREELEGLQRWGWRLVNGVRFRPADDVDHVVIGPAGVVIVETKWGSADWAAPRQRGRIDDAVEQVSRYAKDVRLFLRPDIGTAPVRPVVALWPSDERINQREAAGVTVMPGLSLRTWISDLPTGALDEAAVDGAWRRIEGHLLRRDAADLARDGPPPRSVTDYVIDLLQLPFGLLCGFIMASAVLSRLGWPEYLLGDAAIVLLSLAAIRRPLRLVALGVLFGSQAITAILLVAAAATLLA